MKKKQRKSKKKSKRTRSKRGIRQIFGQKEDEKGVELEEDRDLQGEIKKKNEGQRICYTRIITLSFFNVA